MFHLAFAHHWAGLHRGMDFIPRTVQKTGVDKGHTVLRGADTFLEVRAGAAFLVHDAQLDGVLRQAQNLLDTGKDFIGKGHLVGAVHFGFYHIDRTGDRVAQAIGFAQIMHGNQRGQHGIHQPLGDFVAITVQNGRIGHQMPDIAHQHQGAALQGNGAAIGADEFKVGI